ncbi:MAG: c-type cytochrome [Hyphomicrobium sp.]|nr:MAG: c-type cytochrome [Hyphomicrobium sp.]MBZ0210712.1 c-type cytochrome [Hyphomicrobium sp.]
MPQSPNNRPLRLRLPLLLVPGLTAVCLAAAALGGAPAPVRISEAAIPNEPGEESPGGSATTRDSIDTREAFSHFSHGIGLEGEAKFKVGNAIFRKLWVSAPSSTTSSDGLGPLYNSRSCQSCHLKDGRGRPPAANFPADTAESMFLRLSIPPQNDEHRRLLAERHVNTINEPTYGEQLQNIAIQGLDNEGHMHIDYKEEPLALGDGTVVSLRRPTYSIEGLKYGPLHPDTMLSPRVAPPMIGVGLLEAIPEADIRTRADAGDKDKDGISGRTNEVWSAEHNKVALGRFGWKAGKPSVREQAAGAFAGDMGLSTPLVPNPSGDCTAAQPACLNAPNGNTERDGGLEVGAKLFDHVVFYSQNLAVPPRRNFNDPAVNRGKTLFYALRCQSCHTPSFTTGKVEGQPHLSKQKIWPYTDLLLHDMGEGLADNRPEGMADGREWRTAPLWGLGLTRLVSGHTQFLHDGRARSIEEAILWHAGEAKSARDGYAALSKADREALIKFVESL